MRKMLSLVLALFIACLLLPAAAESSSFVGTWYLVRAEASGMTMGPETFASVGLDMTLELREDGTFTSYEAAMGQTQELSGSWEYDGTNIVLKPDNAITSTVSVVGDELMIEASGAKMYLSRSKAESSSSVPAVIPADSAEQFNGEYVLDHISIMGINMGVEDMFGEGASMTVTIENGTGTITASQGSSSKRTITLNSEFVDGTLVTDPVEVDDDNHTPLVVTLRDDNTVYATAALQFQGIDVEASFVLVPVY